MKSILTISLALIVSAGLAQTKIDTALKVKLSQADTWGIRNNVNAAIEKIHKLHIDALDRDAIDALLAGIPAAIEQRYQAKLDSVKVKTAGNK